jgi:hypothetical protein
MDTIIDLAIFVAIGATIFCGVYLFSNQPLVRTDLKQWVEEANAQADDYHKIRAYKIAAERLGVAIRIAEPVDCAASRSLCRGMSGIYIRRSHAYPVKTHRS